MPDKLLYDSQDDVTPDCTQTGLANGFLASDKNGYFMLCRCQQLGWPGFQRNKIPGYPLMIWGRQISSYATRVAENKCPPLMIHLNVTCCESSLHITHLATALQGRNTMMVEQVWLPLLRHLPSLYRSASAHNWQSCCRIVSRPKHDRWQEGRACSVLTAPEYWHDEWHSQHTKDAASTLPSNPCLRV